MFKEELLILLLWTAVAKERTGQVLTKLVSGFLDSIN